MPEINWMAVVASTVAAFILGGLWYGPLFSKPWMREMGVGRDFKPKLPRPVLFGFAILSSFVAAAVFSAFVGPNPSLGLAVGAGIAVGVAWVAPCMATTYLFGSRSLTLIAVDAGFPIAQFTIYGVLAYVLR